MRPRVTTMFLLNQIERCHRVDRVDPTSRFYSELTVLRVLHGYHFRDDRIRLPSNSVATHVPAASKSTPLLVHGYADINKAISMDHLIKKWVLAVVRAALDPIVISGRGFISGATLAAFGCFQSGLVYFLALVSAIVLY